MSNNKYKILVIEDEANIRTFMETVLESNNYQMICAGSCGMGKTMFLSHTPDLVILDLGLPDEDGLMFWNLSGGILLSPLSFSLPERTNRIR